MSSPARVKTEHEASSKAPSSHSRKKGSDRTISQVVVTVVLLVAAGLWTNHAVEKALEEGLEDAFESVLDSCEASIKNWRADIVRELEAWAGHIDVLTAFEKLNAIAVAIEDEETRRDALNASVHQESLRAALQQVIQHRTGSRFILMSLDGVLLGSSEPEIVGSRIEPRARAEIGRELEDRGFVTAVMEPSSEAKSHSEGRVLHVGVKVVSSAKQPVAGLLLTVKTRPRVRGHDREVAIRDEGSDFLLHR